jgi:GDP-mannose 6-dehydrogenase
MKSSVYQGAHNRNAILKFVNNESTTPNGELRVAVLGLGYVGCVSAACLAHLGHHVIGVDRDEFKVQSVLDGTAPFYEPGLEELIKSGRASGRLSASTSLAESLKDADIALICVGTPSEKNGSMSMQQLRRISEEIATHLPGRTKQLIITIRSTVWPGTNEEIYDEIFHRSPQVTMVSNPEFLREGVAVQDFMEPSLLVVGGEETEPVRKVASLYGALPVEGCLVSLRTAETIKYSCNAFHALKIAFANEIGSLCSRLDISAQQVMDTFCRDLKLNISPAYLRPGFAFGGSCLGKDLRALLYQANRLDINLPLLKSVLPSNDEHLQRAIRRVLEHPGGRIGVFGLAFKENTDDLRESPVVTLLEQLIGKGREVRIFDPHIRLDLIYGSNQQFLLKAIPHIGKLMESELEKVLDWAEFLVITQKPSKDMEAILSKATIPIVNVAV